MKDIKMRSLNKLFAVFILSVIFFSCEKEEILFEGPFHVRFTDTTATFKESHPDTINIQVHNAGPQLEEDVDITYLVSGTAREGKDFEFVSEKGVVTIEDGESFGNIQIRLINNANNILEQQTIILTLLSVSNRSLSVGQGKIGDNFVLTIEDDCILGGVYTAQYTNNFQVPPISGITITSNDCQEYRVSNWDINLLFIQVYFQSGFLLPLERDLTFIDNLDNTITIPQQNEQTLPEEFDQISGTGAFNPNTGVITLNISLDNLPEAPVIQISFRPQNPIQ